MMFMHAEATAKPPDWIWLVVPLLLLASLMMGADAVEVELVPVRYLGIPFPWLLHYAYYIAPAASLVVWLVLRRRLRTFAVLPALLLWGLIVFGTVEYAKIQLAAIPLTRPLRDQERSKLDQLSFRYCERASSDRGNEVLVEKKDGRPDQLRAELTKLGVLRSASK